MSNFVQFWYTLFKFFCYIGLVSIFLLFLSCCYTWFNLWYILFNLLSNCLFIFSWFIWLRAEIKIIIGLPAQLSKIHNPTLTISSNTTIQPVSSARNLGIIFDSNLSFSDHISYISKSCFSHIRDLRRIRNTLDHKTACTIATSLIHSKLDYCNSLYLNISNQQLNRLQLILNSAARAVTKTPKFHHITPHLKSGLHWLKITQRIQYKILSLTYKSLQYNKPSSISDLLTIQPTRSTRSSAVVTLQRPSNPSRLKISDRSFYFQAPALWNALPHHLRSHSHSSESHSLLSLSSSQFHKQLKTHLFLHSYPP